MQITRKILRTVVEICENKLTDRRLHYIGPSLQKFFRWPKLNQIFTISFLFFVSARVCIEIRSFLGRTCSDYHTLDNVV